MPRSAKAKKADRDTLVQRAFRLEWLTAGWMVVEAVIAVGSGVAANSLTLVAFGADSVIELISACVLLWRLSVDLRQGNEFSERAEHIASKLGGVLLFALALYVAASGAWSLWSRTGQEFSTTGLVLAVVATPTMYFLAKAKLRIAGEIDSSALRADAVESITCCYLSIAVVAGLVVQLFLNAWWIDGVTALAFVPFLLREGWEAWEGKEHD